MIQNRTFCVIMAGGIGSRFWPLSKEDSPKQFLDILGIGKTLIQQTYERFLPICPKENFLIVTSEEYFEKVQQQLPDIKPQQILLEPVRRNTAPCIAYANAHIRKRRKDALIVVTPSDHLITNEDEFRSNIVRSLEFADKHEALLTMGIKPHRPETGYGYIQVGNEHDKAFPNFKTVKTFTEKPNIELATMFYESGEFFWNSGIFIWSLTSIDHAFQSHLNEVQQLFDSCIDLLLTDKEKETIKDIYAVCRNISIDYGVMEKASNVFVQTVSFGWSDLGTWSSLHEHSPKDISNNSILKGQVLLYNSKDSIVHLPQSKKAIIYGLNDYIVVDSEDALLICPKNHEQAIRQYVTDLKSRFGKA